MGSTRGVFTVMSLFPARLSSGASLIIVIWPNYGTVIRIADGSGRRRLNLAGWRGTGLWSLQPRPNSGRGGEGLGGLGGRALCHGVLPVRPAHDIGGVTAVSVVLVEVQLFRPFVVYHRSLRFARGNRQMALR